MKRCWHTVMWDLGGVFSNGGWLGQVSEALRVVEGRRSVSNLIKVGWQVGPELDHQVPPDLHLGEQQGLRPDVDGNEGLHQELHTFGAAQDVFRSDTQEIKMLPWWLWETKSKSSKPGLIRVTRISCSPGLRAKLSIRLFQARKAIFLMVGEELRKPSSSRCSRELMKGPPLWSSCVQNTKQIITNIIICFIKV